MIKSHKILIADDDSDLRNYLALVLSKAGYELVQVDSGEKVIEVVAQEAPDLILMDANLPNKDGWTLTMEIKAMGEFSHIPIISLTVCEGGETAKACGSSEYIPKPIDPGYLVERIASYLK